MKRIHFLCTTTFLVLLKSVSVTALSEEIKQLAAVVSADFSTIHDDFNFGILKFTSKPVNLPQIDFENSITLSFEEKNATGTVNSYVHVLGQTGGIFTLKEYRITNGGNVEHPESLTSYQVQYLGEECDKIWTSDGQTYNGFSPACAIPPGSNGYPIVLHMTMNCTQYTATNGGRSLIVIPTTRFSLPDEWKPSKSPCSI